MSYKRYLVIDVAGGRLQSAVAYIDGWKHIATVRDDGTGDERSVMCWIESERIAVGQKQKEVAERMPKLAAAYDDLVRRYKR